MPKYFVDNFADGLVTLRTPGNNYRNSFTAVGNIPAVGDTVVGVIRARAWKAETVSEGGNYVEPLYGRPRRMQGTVLAANAATNELTVKTPYEVVVKLPDRYRAEAFAVGSRVGFDNQDVPTFEVQG